MWWMSLAFAGAGLRIELDPGSPPYSAVEVRCGTWRERAEVVDGAAEFAAIPPTGECKAFFKGSAPASLVVHPDDRLACGFRGTVAVCRHGTPVPQPPESPVPTAARVVLSPNLVLAPDAPDYARVRVSCGRFEADVALVERAATIPGLPDTGCTATFSSPPPMRVSLPGGPSTCDGAGRCVAGVAAPAPATAPVTVTLEGSGFPVTAVEVSCPSGFRSRTEVVEGHAVVPDVPFEPCTLYLKGLVPTRTRVSGGETKACVLAPGTSFATCS